MGYARGIITKDPIPIKIVEIALFWARREGMTYGDDSE